MTRCPKCGCTENGDNAKFCTSCGERLSEYTVESDLIYTGPTPLSLDEYERQHQAKQEKKGGGKGVIIAVVVLLMFIVGCIFFFAFGGLGGGSGAIEMPAIDSIQVNDTTAADSALAAPVCSADERPSAHHERREDRHAASADASRESRHAEEPAREVAREEEPSSGSCSLSYGKYKGKMKGGYPHGKGRLTYTTTRVINRNDSKGRTANAGDYVEGEFFNGFLVYGKHYDADGNLIESINVGVGSEDSYESR